MQLLQEMAQKTCNDLNTTGMHVLNAWPSVGGDIVETLGGGA